MLSEPDPFQDAFVGAVAARAVGTAAMLGVFDALAEGDASAAELAEKLGLDELGAQTLAGALVALGYLDRVDGRLRNAPVTRRLLVSSSPESIATFVGAQGDLHWEVLSMVPEAVKSGRAYAMHEERRDPERWRAYMRGLYEISRPDHEENAALVDVEEPRLLVDVAGGHGGFSMAMCRRHPTLRAVIADLPPAAAVGREIVEEQGFGERIEFREGDVFETGLEQGADVVSVFNLVHHLPDERNRLLVRMAREALGPGGALVIGDSELPEPGEDLGARGALSSLLFYAWSHARNFTREEIVGWLHEAGFGDVVVHRNTRAPWRLVVIGRVPG